MTKPEHEERARDFVDSILEVNRQHGFDSSTAAIEYDAAVQSVAKTFERLGDGGDQVQSA